MAGIIQFIMRLSFRFLVVLLAFSALGLGAGRAGEKVWAALYLAENRPPGPEAHLATEKMTHRLQAVFGFRFYYLRKAQEIELGNEWEQWFIPRRDFFIRVEPLRRVPGEPRVVDYEIYQEGFIVAKGRYEPRNGTPLFINGPDFHQGRLILVLDARSEPATDL
jgi:hypothetical protein